MTSDSCRYAFQKSSRTNVEVKEKLWALLPMLSDCLMHEDVITLGSDLKFRKQISHGEFMLFENFHVWKMFFYNARFSQTQIPTVASANHA